MSTTQDLKAQKTALRKEVLERRAHLNDAERTKASFLAFLNLMQNPAYQQAQVLLGFASYGSELNIDGILNDAMKLGKKVYLPKVCGEELQFYLVDKLEALELGYKGIREPKGDTECFDLNQCTDKAVLMLMPGVAFDKEKHRMGYGKGFYDRYLAQYPGLQGKTMALGFTCQLVEQVPCEEQDIKPATLMLV